jgi:hypothetical protein
MSAKFFEYIKENLELEYSDGKKYQIDRLPIEIDWSEENSVKAYAIYTPGFKYMNNIRSKYNEEKKFVDEAFDISKFKEAMQKSEHWYSLLEKEVEDIFPEHTDGKFGLDIIFSEFNV